MIKFLFTITSFQQETNIAITKRYIYEIQRQKTQSRLFMKNNTKHFWKTTKSMLTLDDPYFFLDIVLFRNKDERNS